METRACRAGSGLERLPGESQSPGSLSETRDEGASGVEDVQRDESHSAEECLGAEGERRPGERDSSHLSPLAMWSSRFPSLLSLPSPPPLLFAFAPVLVTGPVLVQRFYLYSGFCVLSVLCEGKVGFFLPFSSTVLLAEIQDCHQCNPARPRCGNRGITPSL